jgi:hypothetical protein
MRPKLAAIAASALLALSFVTPARAAVTQPLTGELCQWGAVHPQGDPDLTVVFRAGPFGLADEDDPYVVHTGTVTCTMQKIDAPLHTDPDYVSVTGPASAGVASLPPTTATTPDLEPVEYLCTQLDVDGTTLYWNDPDDRNEEGWWTTSTSARCENQSETLEFRFGQDSPSRQLYTALGLATGDFVSFARLPAGGAVLGWVPLGWSCTDIQTGLAVGPGSTLAVPDPGVACLPPTTGLRCWRTEVTGFLAPTVLGRVWVRSACGAVAVERQLTPVQGAVLAPLSNAFGTGSMPFTCSGREDAFPAAPAYTVVCGVFNL